MNDDQNGMPTMPALPVPGRPDVVQALEQALMVARQGKVAGVIVICAHGPDQLSMASAGLFPSTLIAGCRQISRQLLDAMFAKKSSILQMRR